MSSLNLATLSIQELKGAVKSLIADAYSSLVEVKSEMLELEASITKDTPKEKKAEIRKVINRIEQERLIECYNEIRQLPAIMLHGSPGIGKSDGIKQLANELGIGFKDVRLTTTDSVDLRGLPMHDTDNMVAKWLPAGFLPNKQDNAFGGIMLMDELNAVPSAIQTAAYQIVLDKKIGEYELPDGWIIIAAGNKSTDKGVVYRLPTPLANRFIHLEIVVDIPQWIEWAEKSGLDPFVVNFIKGGIDQRHRTDDAMKSILFAFDPKSPDVAFPTPRSWHNVAKLQRMRDTDFASYLKFVSGTVGRKAQGLFLAFLNHRDELPDPESVLSGVPYDMPDKYDAVYAMISMLVHAIQKNPTVERIDKFTTNFIRQFDDNNRIDLAVLAAKNLANYIDGDLYVASGELMKFIVDHRITRG